jgi:hypothetical protein
MAAEQFANNAQSTLTAAITAGATSLTVQSAAAFPSSPQFRILIDSEILLVTAVSGNTFTVTRAAEAVGGVQQAAAHAPGTYVTHVITAGALGNLLPGDLAKTDAANSFTVAPQTVTADSDSHKGVIIKGHSATQSADLQQWQKSDGTVLSYLTKDGYLILPGGTTTVDGQTVVFSFAGYANLSSIRFNGADTNANNIYCRDGNPSPFGISTANQDVSIKCNYGFSFPGIYLYHSGTGQMRCGFCTSSPAGRIHVVCQITSDPLLILDGTASQTGQMIQLRQVSSTNTTRKVAVIDAVFASSTDASYRGRLVLSATDYSGDREGVRVEADGSQALLGFYGVTAIARAVLATGAGHTVDDVITALQNLGLVKQS